MTEEEARQILGLRSGSSGDEVRRAYLDLVKIWHPDRFQSDSRLGAKAEGTLRQINQAYDVLRRAAGQSEGRSARTRRSATPGPQAPTTAPPPLAPVVARAAVLGLCAGAVVTLVIWWPVTDRPSPEETLDAGAVVSLPPEDPARPLSGSEVLIGDRKGQGILVLQNAGQLDAVVVLFADDRAERAFYVRGGEQLTALDIAPGSFHIRMMTGRKWMTDRFTADQGYEEVVRPTTFAQPRSREGAERTRVTLAFGTMDESADLRRADPFSLLPQ